jgi:hypothetical protein
MRNSSINYNSLSVKCADLIHHNSQQHKQNTSDPPTLTAGAEHASFDRHFILHDGFIIRRENISACHLESREVLKHFNN